MPARTITKHEKWPNPAQGRRDILGAHMRPLILLLICIPELFAGEVTGLLNLGFEQGTPGLPPTGWNLVDYSFGRSVPLTGSGAAAELRERGCYIHPRCVFLNGMLEQVVPAALYRGKVIRISGWIQLTTDATVPPSLSLRVKNMSVPYGELTPPRRSLRVQSGLNAPTYTSEIGTTINSQGSAGWERFEFFAYVEESAAELSVVLDSGRSGRLFDGLQVEALPTVPVAELPDEIVRHYRELDESTARDDTAQISSLLLSVELRPPAPFLRQLPVSRASDAVTSQTKVRQIIASSEQYFQVLAESAITRSSSAMQYSYKLAYRDVWVFAQGRWQLLDEPPIEIESSATAPPHAPAASAALPPTLLPCGLKAGPNSALGPPIGSRFLPAVGQPKALMLFVESPVSPHTQSTRDLYNRLAVPAIDWLRAESGGRLNIEIEPLDKWYSARADTKTNLERLLQDVSHDTTSLATYDIVYVVSWSPASDKTTHALLYDLGKGISVPGREIRHFVIIDAGFSPKVVLHETLHLFGLPDLYVSEVADPATALTSFVGAWDVMSDPHGAGGLLTSWNRAMLGWLSQDQLKCATSKATVETLTPVSMTGDRKAMIVPLSPTQAYVVELRERVQSDEQLCGEGLLLYKVDTAVPKKDPQFLSYPGPPMLILRGGDHLHQASETEPCGARFDAAIDDNFEDADVGVSIKVIRAELGAWDVQVSRTK